MTDTTIGQHFPRHHCARDILFAFLVSAIRFTSCIGAIFIHSRGQRAPAPGEIFDSFEIFSALGMWNGACCRFAVTCIYGRTEDKTTTTKTPLCAANRATHSCFAVAQNYFMESRTYFILFRQLVCFACSTETMVRMRALQLQRESSHLCECTLAMAFSRSCSLANHSIVSLRRVHQLMVRLAKVRTSSVAMNNIAQNALQTGRNRHAVRDTRPGDDDKAF